MTRKYIGAIECAIFAGLVMFFVGFVLGFVDSRLISICFLGIGVASALLGWVLIGAPALIEERQRAGGWVTRFVWGGLDGENQRYATLTGSRSFSPLALIFLLFGAVMLTFGLLLPFL